MLWQHLLQYTMKMSRKLGQQSKKQVVRWKNICRVTIRVSSAPKSTFKKGSLYSPRRESIIPTVLLQQRLSRVFMKFASWVSRFIWWFLFVNIRNERRKWYRRLMVSTNRPSHTCFSCPYFVCHAGHWKSPFTRIYWLIDLPFEQLYEGGYAYQCWRNSIGKHCMFTCIPIPLVL